jgi:hypothetical protein
MATLIRTCLVVTALSMLGIWILDDSSAMKQCMEKHSRDTCTYSLSR